MIKTKRKLSVSLLLGPETEKWFVQALELYRKENSVDTDLTAVVRGTLLRGMRSISVDQPSLKCPLSTHH